MTRKYVYLGRFSPFHLGHEGLLRTAVKCFGEENCLVIIASSSSLNGRTPYSFEARQKMIKAIFPEIEILPLPDAQPEKEYFDGSTNGIWLDQIEDMAKNRNEEFTFVGGSQEDLTVLGERFETEVLIDRFGNSEKISATKIREALKMINPKIWPQVINFDYKG